jgi:hypothetical protein
VKTEFLSRKPCVDLLEGMINICYGLQIDRIGRGRGARNVLCGQVWKFRVTSSSSSSIVTTTLSWVSACSPFFEHSQQEGFTESRCQRHVQPPTWRRTRDSERSNFRHKRPPASEATLANPAAEGGTTGEKWPRTLPKVATSTSLSCSFTCRKARHGTDGFTSPPNEGVLRIFSPEKSDGFGRV